MGDYFQDIVDLDAEAAGAPALAARALDWLVREGIVRSGQTDCVLGAPLGHPPGPNWSAAVAEHEWAPSGGLAVKTGRTVFHGGQGGTQYAVCPRCDSRTWFHTEDRVAVEGAADPFYRAIDLWYATGDAGVVCPACSQASDLAAWRWEGDYFAFGHLGFEFWNWPVLAPDFLAALARTLGGHRLTVVGGKL